MKKLLSTLIMLTLVMAFATSASATTILFAEEFNKTFPNVSTSWGAYNNNGTITIPNYYIDFLSLKRDKTNEHGGMLSNAKYDISGTGKTYYLTVEVVALNVNAPDAIIGLGVYSDSAGYRYVEDFTINAVNKGGYDVAKDSMTTITYAIADANRHNWSDMQIIIQAKSPGEYLFGNITLSDGPLTPAVPIPGAIFLIAPGVAGLAALKRRMK